MAWFLLSQRVKQQETLQYLCELANQQLQDLKEIIRITPITTMKNITTWTTTITFITIIRSVVIIKSTAAAATTIIDAVFVFRNVYKKYR